MLISSERVCESEFQKGFETGYQTAIDRGSSIGRVRYVPGVYNLSLKL